MIFFLIIGAVLVFVIVQSWKTRDFDRTRQIIREIEESPEAHYREMSKKYEESMKNESTWAETQPENEPYSRSLADEADGIE